MLRMYTLCLAGIIGLGLGAAGCDGGGHASGYFGVSWDFAAPWSTCSGAGVTEVDLGVQNVRTGASLAETFYCTDYQVTSDPLPVDDYFVSLSAYESHNAQTPVSTTDYNGDVYRIYAGVVTYLPPVTFSLQH